MSIPLLSQPAPRWQPSRLRSAEEERSNLLGRQLLIWTGQQLHPDLPVYNVPFLVAIAGHLSLSHFRAAFQALLDRSDALRTVFGDTDGIPQRRVVPPYSFALEHVDLSKESDANKAFQEWLARRTTAPSTLSERAFDTALITLAPNQSVWYLNQHHIITDGHSTGLICRWVSAFYELAIQNRLGEAPALPSFEDYVEQRRVHRASEHYQKAAAYWSNKMATPAAPLSYYNSRPLAPSTHERSVTLPFGAERAEKFLALAQERGMSGDLALFSVFASLVFAFLYRLNGERRLRIGTPLHNRVTPSNRARIGLLMEVYPLDVEVTDEETFESLVAKSLREVFDVGGQLPYCVGSTAHRPPFDVMVNCLRLPAPAFHGLPARLDWGSTGRCDGSQSLAITLHQFGGADLTVRFDFNAAVFDEYQRQEAVTQFISLTDRVLADPGRRISDLSLLSPLERERIVVGFNRTAACWPADAAFPQLFEAHAEAVPERVAVVHGEESATYSQLNARANRLAHHLRRRGIGPGKLVGVCCEPSVEMLVGLLGVLKAGGAYVPLDPAYPKERVAFMLRDAQVAALLTQERIVRDLPKHGAEVIRLDGDWPQIGRERESNPPSSAGPLDLAYVIYTSGSTGRPKGVQVSRGGLANLLNGMGRILGLTEQDVLLAVTTLSFDIAALELFLPIALAARVVIVSREVATDGTRLAERLSSSRATVMQATPATWQLLLDSGWQGSGGLKILCGGEPLSRNLADELLRRAGSVWNGYGPTETTIYSTTYKVEPGEAPITIGQPVTNTDVYLLDRHREPVPIGVPGELHIGGAGVARGYLERPDLTADKYVPDPFGARPGGRLYKTGDLARYLPSGDIECLGRVDRQVKLRGFRIELGEIEATLSQHPAVQEAVALVREDVPGERRLVAYVVATRQHAFNQGQTSKLVSQWRAFLLEKLPDYMVPTRFVQLEAMPRLPNGKIDRDATPRPGADRSELEGTLVAPGDALEAELVQIWQHVLSRGPIGVRDDFFELGGQSLEAVRLAAQVKTRLGKIVSPTALVRARTIEQQAAILREDGLPSRQSALVAIQPEGNRTPFFCVPPAATTALVFADLARCLGKDQPFYGFDPLGLDGNEVPQSRIEDMAAHYVREIRSRQPQGPYFLGGMCFGGLVAFEMAQQLVGHGQRVGLLLIMDTLFPPAVTARGQAWSPSNIPLRFTRTLARRMVRLVKEASHVGPWVEHWRRGRLIHALQHRVMSTFFVDGTTHIVRWMVRRMFRPSTVRRVMDAHVKARFSYVARVYPGPITLLQSKSGARTSSKEGWSNLTSVGVETYEMPTHRALFDPRHLRPLAEKLRECLDQASERENRQQVLSSSK